MRWRSIAAEAVRATAFTKRTYNQNKSNMAPHNSESQVSHYKGQFGPGQLEQKGETPPAGGGEVDDDASCETGVDE